MQAISGYFSTKMVRLILMLAPAAAVSGAMALEAVLRWCFQILLRDLEDPPAAPTAPAAAAAAPPPAGDVAAATAAADGGGKAGGNAKKEKEKAPKAKASRGEELDAKDVAAAAKSDAEAVALARQKELEAMSPLEVGRAVLFSFIQF